ncbi:uncharacterized protein LOC102900768 [Felis catus]|uniref:uncharacterized protein LOC102900768 n=1 Tax=Felis catus TaxID=9685 RepID=UPI001D19E88D|nr:uncharacterized protein LOC102900768 [Felis catus]
MGTFLAPGALSLRSRRPCWRFGHREPPGAPGYLLPPPASSPRRPRPPRLTGRVRGGSGSAAFTPAEEAPAAPWSPAPLPLPLARLLSVRSLPLANFRVLRSTRNRGDPQQVLLAQGRELRGKGGGAAGCDFEANTGEGAYDFVSGRGAPRRPRVSPSVSGDRGGAHNRWGGGLAEGQKGEGIKVSERRYLGRRGGGRRGRGEAEAANDRDPEATGKLSAPRRHRRRPHPKRTQSRLPTRPSPLSGTAMERRELGRKAECGRGMESHRLPGPGQRDPATPARLRTDPGLGNPPVPQASKESKPRKCLWWKGEDPMRRLPAAHPVPIPPAELATAVAGLSAARLGSRGRGRVRRSPRAQSQARRGRGEEDLASPPLPPPPTLI